MNRLLFLALLPLAGCITVGPDYERPEMPLPAQYPAPAAEKATPAVSPQWWTLYRDPLLDELVAAARMNNADVRFAVARVLEAEAQVREARAAFFPEVMGGYSATRSRVSAAIVPPPQPGVALTRTQNQVIAATVYEVDFWGRIARASEAAQANLLASEYAKDTVFLTLSGLTAQTYFALRSLDVQVAVLEATIRTRGDALSLARARLAAGFSPELDVYQAQGTLSDALVQKRDAERNRALAERLLGQLTGRPDLHVPPGDLPALPFPPTPAPGLPSSLLERRPDIRAAEELMVAANAQIGVARAALFPSITLTGSLGSQSAEFSNLLTSGAGIWSLGFGLLQPIFDAGRREARVDQASARREQALANYQRTIETAFREVSDALVNIVQAGSNEADLQERLEAARNALELSTLRYERGYSPFLEVLDAQRTMNEAELAFVRNRQARLAFSVDLIKALGGGWAAPE
ncbi:MAG: efflux transporter outer membrane subunit [Burkholderiales bacterium]|nr:efflux transporter outer membrane subunit [Burkholderiales bacterium]